MTWHFGHNCTQFVPPLGKCRVKIDLYSGRPELVTRRWLKTWELFLYTNRSADELLSEVRAGDIQAKRVKADGSLRFLAPTTWAWDDCPLADSGGQCLHYYPHDGEKIACLKDLEGTGFAHPNLRLMPLDDSVATFEDRVSAVLGAAK